MKYEKYSDCIAKRVRYRQHCQQAVDIPLFSRDWWLDATCGVDQWQVALVESDGDVVASMPYWPRRRRGFILLMQPALTQSLGPWFRSSAAKYAKQLGDQKTYMGQLIDQLPSFDLYLQNWHYSISNWLPFYWRGFKQTTRYTYVIDDLSNPELIWAGFKENIRTDIRKAENRFNLKVRDDLGLDYFIKLNRQTFARQNMQVPYSDELLRCLDRACAERNCRKIWIAEDSQGRAHAGIYVVWDENSAYYLMGGGDPALRSSGATSLCLWHAIRHAACVTKRFDFEGSMLEPVERLFRGFGARQVPYLSISKMPSRLLRLRQFIIDLSKS